MIINDLLNLYSGASCYLVCGGPSLEKLDLSLLDQRGIISMGINNVTALNVRTQLWVCGDNIKKFCVNIFKDPGILKFVPTCEMNLRLRDNTQVNHLPGIIGYRRGYRFDHNVWLSEEVCTWGNDKKHVGTDGVHGKRSTMLVALKLLYMLGFRVVYIIGADFSMSNDRPYVFNETKNRGGVAHNNALYNVLNKRFELLQPFFLNAGFKIFNCTAGGNLGVFPRIDFVQSIALALDHMPGKIDTFKMYTLPSTVSRQARAKLATPNLRARPENARVRGKSTQRVFIR